MVVLTDKIQKRLTIQTADIAVNTTAIRSLDWERDRFDIEFGLQNGTTYNSFIIRGDKLALVDTSHEKFRQLYLDTLKGLIDPSQIDYLIISHTEPDHSGLVRDILALAPNVTVVGSKVAIQFLENFVHQPFTKQIVKNGDVFWQQAVQAVQQIIRHIGFGVKMRHVIAGVHARIGAPATRNIHFFP